MSQVLKLGYERSVVVHAWKGMGNRLGMPADAQASWHDSTVHAQRFFPPKMQKQMTVTSFDDVTDILLMNFGGRYKSRCTWDPGVSWLVQFSSLVHSFGLFVWLVPWLVHPGSHRPSNLATSVPLEEWNYNQTGKCSLFVQLYMLKATLGTLSWCALVVCKLVR